MLAIIISSDYTKEGIEFFTPKRIEKGATPIFSQVELIRKGFERTGLSKWKETAEKTLVAYNRAANLIQ